jgi:hypothetical protein
MDINDISEEEVDPFSELTYEDYIGHPETLAILEDDFFENFKKTMEEPIEHFYNSEVEDAIANFMQIFDKDFNKRNCYDFFLTIYPFISKNYDMSIFDKFPFLAKSLLITGEENEIKKEKPKIIIESKKYDWDAKKI